MSTHTPNAPAPSTGNYAAVNGINLYYETHGMRGIGNSLVLLHGGVGSIEMFGPVLPLLAAGRQVIAVDLQAHGHTADVDRPMRFETIAGDADSVRTAHAVQFFELLGGGQKDAGWDGSGMSNARLAILPGTTHYTIFALPLLAATVIPFLEAA